MKLPVFDILGVFDALERTTEIISVEEGFSGLQSGHLISSDQFPAGSYTEGPRGMRLWMFVNNRPGTTLRLKFNDMYLKPPQMVGFCPTAFINVRVIDFVICST